MFRPLLVVGLLAVASETYAALFGVSSVTDSYYSIDTATGAATFISTADGNVSFSGLSFLGPTLYLSDITGEPGGSEGFDVVSVDLTTGASTFVSDQGGSFNWHGLASNQGAGLLYSIDIDSDGLNLVSLDPDTGTIIVIGPTGIQGRGMDYDDGGGILYATGPSSGSQSLFTVDTTTGAASLIGPTGIDSFLVGLAFDETAGVLYMLADPDNFGDIPSNLYTLDLSTGAATLVGSTDVNGIDGLAWIEVPEPGSLLLFLLGLAGLAAGRRCTKS